MESGYRVDLSWSASTGVSSYTVSAAMTRNTWTVSPPLRSISRRGQLQTLPLPGDAYPMK